MSRFVLILIAGGFITYGIANIAMNKTANFTTQNAISKYEENQARNIANSTVEMLISKLADESDYRTNDPESIELFGGSATYTVTDTTIKNTSLLASNKPDLKTGFEKMIEASEKITYASFSFPAKLKTLLFPALKGKDKDKDKKDKDKKDKDKKDKDDKDKGDDGNGDENNNDNSNGSDISAVKITVNSDYNGFEKEVVAIVSQSSGFVPPVVRAAWTANGPLNKTISDMYIDGRDHDLSWNYIPKTGVFGVSTSQDFTNTENAEIGGTRDSVDYQMSYPENPNVIEENYNWGGSFPSTPDEALGLKDGTLKSIAQSGLNGSQYVTSTKDLSTPLQGVTYIELPYGNSEKIDLGKSTNGSGILVIHNPSGTTEIKQTKADKDCYFQGLIIGDYMFHFHLDVLGAIILLSPNLETQHECNGNKDHRVFYSSDSIKEATSIIGLSGSSSSYSGANSSSSRCNILAWYE